jgi:hypothetical protein
MKTNRKGVAAVEFALVLPLFLILFLGMIELGRGIQVQQVLTNAAREGARYACLDQSTAAQVQSTVLTYMADAHLPTTGVVVTCNPADPDSVRPYRLPDGSIYLPPVSVTVSLPFKSVSWLAVPHYLAGVNLTASATFAKAGIAP